MYSLENKQKTLKRTQKQQPVTYVEKGYNMLLLSPILSKKYPF